MKINPRDRLILGIPGPKLSAAEAQKIKKIRPGGFILFGRNIKDPLELRQLVENLWELSESPPLIAIDQEGGRVARLREIGSEPPSAKELIMHIAKNPNAEKFILKHGRLMGEILSLFGFNLDLCPVLDVSANDDEDNSLKNRTWSTDPDVVTKRASLFIDGLKGFGILNSGKHFPGYSHAVIDPHHDLPTIDRSFETLESTEWKPYKALKHKLDSVMIGHAHYPRVDTSGLPSSLSPRIVHDLLRNEIGFEGCAMTDDIDMGALTERLSIEKSVELAIEAGNELILLCHRFDEAEKVMAALDKTKGPAGEKHFERLFQMKSKILPLDNFSMTNFDRLNKEILDLRIECVGKEKAFEKS